MRITFLRPHIRDVRSEDAMEPLAFAVLAGLTPSDVELDFFDERLEDLPLDHPTDLVGITLSTYTARHSYQVANHFRRRGVPVVVGGYHPTFLPEEALHYADAVLVGDAEGAWPQVVEDARRGQLQRIYKADAHPSLEGRLFDRSIFAGKRYKPLVPVQYGYGCRFGCDFCSIHSFYGSTTRQRPLREVVAEIEALAARYVLFIDDNLLVDRQKMLDLLDAITPLKIQWTCQISIDVARDEILLKAMKRSGCIVVFIGFESLAAGNLRTMRKSWAFRGGSYEDAVNRLHENGIMVWGGFVFGYDHDTPDTFEATAEFAINSRLVLANFLTITPTPGTRLYQRLEGEGRLLLSRWWLDPAYGYGQAVFRPARMTPDQLTEGCLRARQHFYSHSSLFRRLLDPKCIGGTSKNILLCWGANLLYRRELPRKLGWPLGSGEPLLMPEESEHQAGLQTAAVRATRNNEGKSL